MLHAARTYEPLLFIPERAPEAMDDTEDLRSLVGVDEYSML